MSRDRDKLQCFNDCRYLPIVEIVKKQFHAIFLVIFYLRPQSSKFDLLSLVIKLQTENLADWLLHIISCHQLTFVPSMRIAKLAEMEVKLTQNT